MQLFPETDSYPNVSFTIVDVPDPNTVLVAGNTTAYGATPGDPYTIAERCWSYDSGSNTTTYFDASAGFDAFMVGWTFVPDIEKPCFLNVIAVNADIGSITVKGDSTGLATPLTNRYHLIPPPGVSRSTGALAEPEDAGAQSYDDPGTMWLWSGYRYVPPQAGHDVSGLTYGAQSGVYKLGHYHCWNRVYDCYTGRWTTPDPAMSPWANLSSYCASLPVMRSDSSGLHACSGIITQAWLDLIANHDLSSGRYCESLKTLRNTVANMWGERHDPEKITECQLWLNSAYYNACGSTSTFSGLLPENWSRCYESSGRP